jgi:cation:H+ antiporter
VNLELLSYIGLFVVSIVVLLKASDWFVDSSEKIGLSLGISPFVIGVTIVAFGTSLPELASSIVAVVNKDSAIVTGNVIGSNVANICLVLGVVAIVARGIKMDYAVLDVDIPVVVASALLLYVFTYDGVVNWVDGIFLMAMLVIFLISSFRSHKGDDSVKVDAGWKAYALLILGAVGVYFGASYTVTSIQEVSSVMGISSGVIAMSAVALGTSLPEVIVSVAAARKGKPGMAVGNVVGSNIFNSFAVMGIPSFFGDIIVPAADIDLSLIFMIGITLLFAFMAAANNVSRWEGVMLVMMYLIFIAQLF